MGILDDAIREHLELKRKHGVPDDELQRQEEEALGPARRDVARQPEESERAAGATATAEQEETSVADDENAVFDMDATQAEAPPPDAGESAAVDSEEPAAEADTVDQPPGGMEPPPPAEPEPEATPIESDAPDPGPYLGDTEPHGFEALDEDEDLDEDQDEDADEDQDVLEDTPDFLQETPEHDRLWFEQKPPRDFDFD